MRRLGADEAAAWARVAATVRGAKAVPAIAAPGTVGQRPAVAVEKEAVAKTPKRSVPGGNTLDAGWDRKLAIGQVSAQYVIDLHGCTLAAAHARLDAGLASAIARGARIVLLIAGRPPRPGTSRLDMPLRGIIRASIGDWLAQSRHAGAIAAVRSAHPRHGGAGALYVILRRAR